MSQESGEPIGLVYLDADVVIAIYAEIFAAPSGRQLTSCAADPAWKGPLADPRRTRRTPRLTWPPRLRFLRMESLRASTSSQATSGPPSRHS